ncbi:SPT6 [Auxenochlorella protothecoides x Auxenochlorella symbiontica]
MSDLLDDRAGVEEVTEKERPAGSEDEDEDEDEDFEDGDETKEGASGQDSSEEEEGPDDYDYDDKFLVREDEDEDGDGAAEGEAQPPAGAAKHAKKKRRHRELVLEDDDYDLLEENTGIRRARPAAHRRIKKARDADRGLGREGGAQALQEELFGAELEDLEDEDAEAAPSAPTAPPGRAAPGPGARAGDEFDAEEEDEDDWIVDDFEGAEDEGAAAAAGAERRRRRRAMREGVPDIDPDALDEANDIFGDVSDLLAMYEDRKAAGAREAGEEALDEGAEEVDAEEFSDEEVAEALRLQREERRRGSAARRMERAVDPSLLERHFLTARDDAIRDADLPERLQLADDPTPRDWDLGACAAWVTARLAEDPGVAGQLVRAGVREVEGPPPAWHGGEAWRAGELEGGLRSTADRRGLYAGHERGEEGAARGLPPGALPALNDAVAAALEEVYHRHREVPTIGMYAKERVAELLVLRRTDEPYFTKEDEASRTYPAGSIQPRDRVIRRWDVLHAVHDLARRWRALARLRAARAAAYEAALASASDVDEAAGISQCLERLAEAQDREGVEDVDARFRQLTLRGDAGAPAAPRLDDAGGDAASAARRPRAAQKAGGYDLLRRAGLAAAVPRFAFTSAQLAEYLAQGFVPAGAEPPDPPVSPAEFALEYLAPDLGFASGEAALGGIVRAAAAQLAAEPAVRAHARAHHWRACTLSTFPTPAGEGALEPTHPLALAKRLRGKPLASFAGSDLYARVAAAERAGLVTVSLDVAGGAGALTAALEAVYLSGRLAPVAREWEALRLRVLRLALGELSEARLAAEARGRLAREARAALARAYADAVWALASRAPARALVPAAAGEEDEEVPEGERRVVGAVWGPGTPPTTLVALDPAGALVDWLHCPQWSGAVPRRRGAAGPSDDPFADPRRAGDAARVRAFLEAHDPHLLAVGAGHPEARGLHADLAGVLDSVLVHAPGSRLASGLALVWADERVAAAWEGSAAAHAELPTAAGVVRRALALGRSLLDPLASLAALAGGAGAARASRSLHLHPLQGELGEAARDAALDAALAAAAAQVGVDVNALAAAPWRGAVLPHLPGLGPRKAAALTRALARAGGHVPHRAALWRDLGVLGDVVFGAAAPALRVRASHPALANAEVQRLDDSRVHPAHYALALRVARRAAARRRGADGDSGADGDGSDADAEALEEAFAEPRHVEALRLSRLAEALAGEGGEGAGAGPPPGLATLIDIQFEFARPYGELRPKAKRLKEEELFWLCLGETPETLAAGKKVEARVRYVTAGVAFVSLPDLGNIDATIQAGNVSGSHGEVDCRDFMKQGDNLTARIIFLDPAEWRIELSTTSQALNDDAAWEQRLLCSREPYYVPLTLAEKAAAERSRRPAKPAFTPRQIRHPLFENISMNEAAKRLMEEGRPVGSAIFRPSHKGTRNIILSLRMPGGQVWHLDILEGPKGKGTGQLQLGTPLNMEVIPGKKREVYEELDEVVSRFVEPFGLHCQALQRFRHWRDAAWEAASEELVALKAGVPANQAVYCLGVEPRQPGMFYLGYVLGRTPHREFFMVTHRGFHFRKHDYRTVEHMVNQFKKAPRGDSFTTPGARHAAAQPGAGAEPQQPQPPQQPPQPPAEAVRPHYGAHSYPGASTQAYDYPPYPPQYQYPQAGNPYPAYAAGAGVAPGPPPAVNPAVGYGYAAPAWQPPLPQG